MRIPLVTLACLLTANCDSESPEPSAAPAALKPVEISVKDLPNDKVLVGKLGIPFGTIVRASCRGIIPTEDELERTKGRGWKEQIEILSVNGKLLDPPERLDWSSSRSDLEKPAQGETREIFGYETGMFTGVPNRLSEYAPVWQDTSFHFACSFVPLKVASEQEAGE